jgi:O-antigen ligase
VVSGATPKNLKLFVAGSVGVSTAIALWALADDFGLRSPQTVSRLEDWRGLISASLGNTGHIADLCGLGLLTALIAFAVAGARVAWLWGTALVILAAAMVVCFSFHSNVALIVGALTAIALEMRQWRRLGGVWIRFAVLLLAWVAMLAFFVLDTPGNPHPGGIVRQALSSDRLAFGWDSRLVIWSNTLAMIAQHPWLGWGVGCFTHGYPQQAAPWVIANPEWVRLAGAYTNAAHSEALQIWAEMGIVGLALWCVLFVMHFRACARLLRDSDRTRHLAGLALTGLTLMWLLHTLMNFPLQRPDGRLTLVLLLGAAAGMDARGRTAWSIPLALPLRGWRLALGAALVVMLVSFPVGQGIWTHAVERRMGVAYELSRTWHRQRRALQSQGAPPVTMAEWANADLLWNSLEAYDRVLALDPENPDAISGRKGTLYAAGIDLRGGANALPPNDAEAQRLREQSDVFLRAVIDESHRVFETLQSAVIWQELAIATELLGDRNEARRLWVTAFERAPATVGGPDFQRWMQDEEFRRMWESAE